MLKIPKHIQYIRKYTNTNQYAKNTKTQKKKTNTLGAKKLLFGEPFLRVKKAFKL